METEISIAKVLLSLLFVAGLIGLSAFALRWLNDKSMLMRQMGSNKRLKLADALVLDQKHKVFLITRDDEELLIVSNGTQLEVRDASGAKGASDELD